MRIGWIGVGRMGRHMAAHIIKAGHEVTLHDLRKEGAAFLLKQGATWGSTPGETARGSDIVFTSLPTPEIVKEVVLGESGVVQGISPGAVVIDTSTNSLDVVLELSEILASKGVGFMDSPVSGGVKGAETGDLCVMASGDRETYDKVKSVLDLMGDKVMYCGPVGHGTICKLCHQLFGAGMTQIAVEVLTAGVKAGVDLLTLLEAISRSAAGRKPPLSGWREEKFKEESESGPPSVPLQLLAKDIRLACELGRKFLVPMEIGNIVEQRFLEALNRGWGDLDAGVVVRVQEERAGVRLRSRDYGPQHVSIEGQ